MEEGKVEQVGEGWGWGGVRWEVEGVGRRNTTGVGDGLHENMD